MTQAKRTSRSSVVHPPSFVLGIDGGGTRTRAWLANLNGDTLGTGEAGTSNPYAAGYDAAQTEILVAIQSAFDNAKIEKQIVTAVCLGIGGIDRADERLRLQTWAEQNVARHAIVVNDAEIVLAAGSPENWGIALIAGTGSIAWGKSRTGKIARAGGWGYLIGDEGSGFDLARRGLQAAAQFADGRGEPTRLLDAILQFWHLASPQEIIPRMYRSGLKPADIAKLAPLVVQLAHDGDAIAQRLLEQAANDLTTTIIAVARALDLPVKKIPLALTGGLLLETASLRARVVALARERGYRFDATLVKEPVRGAIKLAQLVAEIPNSG